MGIIWLGILAAAAFYAVATYNQLVRLRNSSESAWSDVDVQLKRRYDLVPNLVETVKGYAGHERETFTQVTEARARAMGASGPSEQAKAEGDLTRALRGLFAVAEAYPELKANENFLELQRELSAIEDAIQKARRYYNAVVRDLNTRCESFPSNAVARLFGFARKDYFELESDAERSAPAVHFGA
jgi:LemA protein